MNRLTRRWRRTATRGMTLLEVALALGLLGMAALGAVAVITQARIVPTLIQREAVATRVAADLIARIQLNPQAWRNGLYDSAITASAAQGAPTMTDCGGSGCTPALRATADRAAVAQALGSALPGATLQVQRVGGAAGSARIDITWPLPQHRWIAASAGNACSPQTQCLRIDFAP